MAAGWGESSAVQGNPCSSSSLAAPSPYPSLLLRNLSSNSRACSKISPVPVATVVGAGVGTGPPGSEVVATDLGPHHLDSAVRDVSFSSEMFFCECNR